MNAEKNESVLREIARGNSLIEEEKLDAAETCFRKLCAVHPDLSAALFNLGTVLVLKRQDQEALKMFISVLKLEGDAIDAMNEIGLIHYRAQRFAEAEFTFRDALFIDENDSRILNNLGVVCFVQKRYAEGETFLGRALEIDPDNEDYRINLRDIRDEMSKNQ
jgi:Flp pilus assembly protein TadD